MLNSKLRFHRRNDINALYKKGSSVRVGHLSMKFMPNNLEHSRFGVVVSKKVDKRAVVRNRIRRRIYEILRKNWDNISSGHDALISVFGSELAQQPAKDLEDSVLKILEKAQLFQR